MKMDLEVDNVNDPYTFLDNDRVKDQLKAAIEKEGCMTIRDAKLLTAYAASLLVYRNGQR